MKSRVFQNTTLRIKAHSFARLSIVRFTSAFLLLSFLIGCQAGDHREISTRGDSTAVLDMTDWFEAMPPDKLVEENSILDVSYLLHTPAGKHGFLKTKGPKFYFEDGTEARFWGGNLSAEACFPEKKEAEFMARRLAQAGVNLIRLHHIDVMKAWTDKTVRRSLFGGLYPSSTLSIDPVNLDLLHYLIYCLKKQGIYVFLSHASNRLVAPEDGFPGPEEAKKDVLIGFKYEGFFDPFLVSLQKDYTRELLTRVNPYTGLSLKDDPVLAMMEITNENHLYHYYKKRDWLTVTTSYYQKMISSLFTKWLKNKYDDSKNLSSAWLTSANDTVNLFPGDNLNSIITFPIEYDRTFYQKFSSAKQQDIFDFLTHLQASYNADMYKFLKEIGVKIPITPTSQWMGILPVSRLTAEYDFADAHSYWKHPNDEYNYIAGQEFIQAPMIRDPSGGNIGRLSKYRIYNRPYTISEWNNCLPNPYRGEGVGLMAAYSSLNDWHPMHYALYHQRFEELDTINAFEAFVDPVFTALYPAASILYHRQDVQEAKQSLIQVLPAKDVMHLNEAVEINPLYGLIGKAGIAFSDLSVPETNQIHDIVSPSGPIFKSLNNQLMWDTAAGILTIDTQGTQAAIGFIGGKTINTSKMSITAATDFANIYLTAIDSSRWLLTAVADAQKKGMALNNAGDRISQTGTYPFLLQPVEAVLTIKLKSKPKVYTLSQEGKRTNEIEVKGDLSDGFTFTISKDDQALHYEILQTDQP